MTWLQSSQVKHVFIIHSSIAFLRKGPTHTLSIILGIILSKVQRSIFLPFKPWRECDTLLGESSNYVEAFNACITSLLHGL